MNTIWSSCVQGVKTLYCSRKLRFDDLYARQYKDFFRLDENKPLRILEIGCGPGALAEALKRWYPRAEITAIDRDSEFIRFARENVPGIEFIEGDATQLPFADQTFDVTISNTVSEHIDPALFFPEQRRVLKPGGVCLVLSSRRGLGQEASCLALSEYEQQFWQKASQHDHTMEDYQVCRYPLSESELPAVMEKYGFADVRTGFAVVDLTPDNPRYPAHLAHDMINSHRYTALEAIDSVRNTSPGLFADEELAQAQALTNARFDERIALYERGERQWDTAVSLIMLLAGR